MLVHEYSILYSNRRVRPSGRAARVRAMQSARGDPPAIVLTPQSVSAKAARALRAGAGAGAGAGAAGARTGAGMVSAGAASAMVTSAGAGSSD